MRATEDDPTSIGSRVFELLSSHPFDFLAKWEVDEVDILSMQTDRLSYWTDLQHKVVINLALMCLSTKYRKDFYWSMEIIECRAYAFNEVIKYCLDVVKPLDSAMADHLISRISDIFRPPYEEDSTSVPGLVDVKLRFEGQFADSTAKYRNGERVE